MDAAALRLALAGPRRDRGRFAAIFAPDGATVAPAAMADAPQRLGAAAVCARAVAAPQGAGRGWALRLATAVRQDLWRALQGRRGMAPVVSVRLTAAGGAEIHAAAAFMDSATAAPGTVDAVARLLQDDRRMTRWLDWAARGLRPERVRE
jgi:hypothetical protein